MESQVLELKCPCCDATLVFGGQNQRMTCEYCGNEFDLETLKACAECAAVPQETNLQWDETEKAEWSDASQSGIRAFLCEACGGELLTDDHTAATFCPYCGNAAILPGRLSGGLRPEGVIPFQTTKEDAKAAFQSLCRGKPLLPKFFREEQQLENITGIYVPFWLYDCGADLNGSYKATRIHTWSDANYTYTKTDHYLLRRQADAVFSGIPMDASTKMDDRFMESIEPYDYSGLKDFDTLYLSGYLADKYDVEAKSGEERIRQRVENAMEDALQQSFLGYATVLPTTRQIQIAHSQAKYVLLPVWMLNTKYRGKTYTFAMNGQTGKMTGTLPVCRKRAAGWFAGLWAAFTALMALLMLLF